MLVLSIKAWTSNMRRKSFSSIFGGGGVGEGRSTSTGLIFRDIDWRNIAIKSCLLKQIRYSLVSLHGFLRAT